MLCKANQTGSQCCVVNKTTIDVVDRRPVRGQTGVNYFERPSIAGSCEVDYAQLRPKMLLRLDILVVPYTSASVIS